MPKPKPVPKPVKTRSAAINPRALSTKEVKYLKNGGFIVWVDGPDKVAYAKAGEVWNGPNGKRLIVKARQWETRKNGKLKPDGVVYFIQLTSSHVLKWPPGIVYEQSREGFLNDILMYASLGMAARKLAATQILIEIELEFVMGLATCTVAGAVAHWGLFYVERGSKVPQWFQLWSHFVSILRRSTRKFYDRS